MRLPFTVPTLISAHPSRRNIPLPPTGVFDWYYLQCVILRFASDQYKQLPDITFLLKPLMASRLKMLVSMMNLRILRIVFTELGKTSGARKTQRGSAMAF